MEAWRKTSARKKDVRHGVGIEEEEDCKKPSPSVIEILSSLAEVNGAAKFGVALFIGVAVKDVVEVELAPEDALMATP